MFTQDKTKNEKLFWRFNQDDGLMYRKEYDWEIPSEAGGKRDCLWRTSLAHIAYPKEYPIWLGLFGCYRIKKNGKIKYSRAGMDYGSNDVSRDQVIMFLAANKINKQNYADLARRTPFHLSRRYSMTPIMWFWVKSLHKKSLFYSKMFNLLNMIELLFVKGFCADTYPKYFLHLKAWMFYTSPWKCEKHANLINYLVNDPDNLLIKMLLGFRVSKDDIDRYQSVNVWRWQADPSKANFQELSWEEVEYNQLDKDILYRIYSLNNL